MARLLGHGSRRRDSNPTRNGEGPRSEAGGPEQLLRGEDLNLRPSGYEWKRAVFSGTAQQTEISDN
jgi:hypothetical protein